MEEPAWETSNSGVIIRRWNAGAKVGLRGRLAALDDLFVPRLTVADENVALHEDDRGNLTELELQGAQDRYRRGLPPDSPAEAHVHLAYANHDRVAFRRRSRTMVLFTLLVFTPSLLIGIAWNTWTLPALAAGALLAIPWAVGLTTAIGLRRRRAAALAALQQAEESTS
jgi:hypothetical protein